jgi:histidyl-tRNA synthetase
MGVRVAVTVGPDEAAKGVVSLKDLRTGTQSTVKRSEAAEAVRTLLG